MPKTKPITINKSSNQNKMKKSLLTLIIALLFGALSFAQPLTGVKTIPGDYPSLASAIASLNTNGVGAGGVTFKINTVAYTETFSTPTAGYITTLTGSAANPIVFMKNAAGVNPIITAAAGVGTMDAIIAIAGCDYVTFDGIDVRDDAANITATSQMEWGYAILKASVTDGSQNITIKNCRVALNPSYTAAYGIYSNNHTTASVTQLVLTATTGSNSNLKIYNNIVSSYFGIYVSGYNHTTSPYAFYDQNNEIGKDGANTITNIGGGTVEAYGIFTKYQNNLKVANNMVTSSSAGTKNIYGIYLTTASNASYDLYSNTVSITFNPTDLFGNANFNAIYCDMGASGTTNTANVYNNTVTNCNFINSAASAATRGIYLLNMGVNVNVYGNSVTNNTIGGVPTATAIGEIRYMWIQPASTTKGPCVVHDNTISGNTRIQSVQGGGLTYFLAISGSGTTLNAYNNTINNNNVASNGGCNGLYVTYADVTSKDIYSNTVSNITQANGSFSGIYSASGVLGRFYKNTVRNISSSATAANANINGIYQSSGPTAVYFYNNMISELSCPVSVASLGYDYNMLNGFYVDASATVKGFYNNTVYLNAGTTSATFGSSAFCAMSLTGVDLRNNIFINTSAAAGVGYTAAIRSRNTSTAAYTNFSSNYNNMYAGTPGPANKIFVIGTGTGTYTSAQTLLDYRTLTNMDLQSISELTPFINVATSPYDIHVKTTVATQCEKGGFAITTPIAISTDFDGDARGTTPDIGADEFAGIANDLTPPQIVYTPFTQTSSFLARTLTATITDGSGVPTSGAGLPTLYWKLNSGSWQAVTGTWVSGSTYTFTFGTATAFQDLISYYIVAQDMAGTPNVGAFPWVGAAGFTANPPASSTPPTTPSSYLIIQNISGIFHVGVGKDYATLTAAVNDLNFRYMVGTVTFLLDDNNYPGETYPIILKRNPGNIAANTITIKPNTGATPVFTSTIGGSGIIILNGLDYVTIDGSNVTAGTDQSLTFENTASVGGSFVLGFTGFSGTDPSTNVTVKNVVLKGSITSPDNETYGVLFNADGSTTAGGFDNITFSNDAVKRTKNAVYITTGTASNINHNIQVLNSTIGSVTPADYVLRIGIAISNSDATLVQGNDVMGPADGAPPTLAALQGIGYYSGTSNTKITGNKIHDWYALAPSCIGIKSDVNSIATVSEISNNLIYNIKCNGMNPGTSQNLAYGIEIRSGGNVKILFNTIYLSGPFLDGYDSYQPSSGCIGFMEWTTTKFDVRNNVFRNAMTNPYPNPDTTLAMGRAYGIMIAGNYATIPAMFDFLDNNDYFIDGYRGEIAMIYGTGGTSWNEIKTLPLWRTYTGKEAKSITDNPTFVSATDLHVTNTNLNCAGIAGTGVTKDFANVNRKSPPDMGAYEFSATISDYHTLPATAVTQSTATLNGDLNTNGEVSETYLQWGLDVTYGGYGIPSGYGSTPKVRSTTLVPLNAPITGLAPNTTYHFQLIGFVSTSPTQTQILGSDLTFTTLPLVPVVVTTAATSVTANAAQLNGTVNPNGVNATVTIEWGLTTAYGNTVSPTPGSVSGSTASAVLYSLSGLTPYTTYHYRVVGTNTGGTTNGTDMTFTTLAVPSTVVTMAASNIVVNIATLNGSVNANYAPTNVSFEWGLTTAYSNTTPATPASVTGSTATPVSAGITGLALGTVYHFRCVGTGPGGTIYGADMQFNSDCPTPSLPGTITGPQSVCRNTTGNIYSVGTIAGATGYNWTVPAGATITAGANTNTITVSYSASASSGNITVAGTNFCGAGASVSLAVTVNLLPVPVILGPTSWCKNAAGAIYTTQTGMTGYVWSITGGTIIAGAGTSSVTVTWNTEGTQTVSVNYNNSNGCSAVSPVAYPVTVLALPVPVITGANVACESSAYLDYTTQAGMSNYQWSMSPNSGTISISNTNMVTIFWTSPGAKWVSVSYTNTNGCTAATPTIYNVTVNPLPVAPGVVTGTASVCAGATGVAYSVAAVTGATGYAWTLPVGATIASGAGTRSITVNFGATAVSGTITAAAQNACGDGPSSPAFPVVVNSLPSAAGAITGTSTVCQGSTGIAFTVPAIASATSYNWTLPAGATVATGANTNSITVNFSLTAVSGNITVNGVNTCGTGTASTFALTVNVKPATPVITRNGNLMTSSAAAGNQWYKNGVAITGATAQTYTILADGTYTDIVTLNGCSSDVSNSIVINHTGVGEADAQVVSVYPNPNKGAFWLTIDSKTAAVYDMQVLNSLGAVVHQEKNLEVSGTFKQYFDLGSLSAGMYTIVLRSDTNQITRKIIINK